MKKYITFDKNGFKYFFDGLRSRNSIVIGLSWWLTLILKVFSVVLLCVPLVIWIRDIETPAHHLAVSNCRVGRWEFYLKVVSLRVETIL